MIKKNSLTCIGSLLIALVSCQTNSAPKVSNHWLEAYLRGKALQEAQPEESCKIFTDLSNQENFSLNEVAYIYSLQICDQKKTESTTATDIKPQDVNEKKEERQVSKWLKKYQHQALATNMSALDKALYVHQYHKYFPAHERVAIYQKGLASREITEEQKKTLSQSLYSLAPRFNPEPPPEDVFRIIKDLYSIRAYDQARDILTKLIKNPSRPIKDKFRAYKNIFYSYKIQKNQKHSQFLEAAKTWANYYEKEVLKNKKHLPDFFEAQITYARTIWTYVSTDKAMDILNATEKKLKGHYSMHMVYWLKARMFEEKKQFDKAFEQLELALKEPAETWEDKERTLWTLSWLRYKNGDYKKAENNFKELIDSKEISPFARFKYMYWLAKTYSNQEKKGDANKTWQALIDEDAFGYYGLLARHHLKVPLKDLNNSKISDKDYEFLSDKQKNIFKDLLAVHETDFAKRFLRFSLKEEGPLYRKSSESIARALNLYSRAKAYKRIFRIFNGLPYDKQKEVFELMPEALFPQPYQEEINQAAQNARLEPEVIYSIIRQESAFDPEARSPMDAFGLMQVLPELAKKASRQHGIPYKNFNDLYDPKTNVMLGSVIIKKQIEKYNNKFVLFVASYNASDAAVKEWLSRFSGDNIVFIENIPYEETKAYVKLVARNFIHYRKLKFGKDFRYFPDHLLEIQ